MVQQRQRSLLSAAWQSGVSLGHKAVPWAVQHMALFGSTPHLLQLNSELSLGRKHNPPSVQLLV